MYYNREHIVKSFTSFGYSFYNFTLSTEGSYDPPDAEFNYADIPHVSYIHKEFETIPAMMEHDKLATIHMQNVLGLRLPMAVICYHHSRTSQTAYFTFLTFLVVVTTEFVQTAPGRTRVDSHYSIGSTRFFKYFAPIVRRLITKNYNGLMKDDIPMRERRGTLRKWGYTFATDSRRYGYEESTDLTKLNVQLPKSAQPAADTVSLEKQLPKGGSVLLGRSDHFGLRILRTQDDEINFYPRLCDHEGASLDEGRCMGKKLQCPWHGKMFQPLATIRLQESGSGTYQTPYHELTLRDGVLTVKYKTMAPAPDRACATSCSSEQPAG